MNTYIILAASDVVHKIFDIYIDTVEAWTAFEAIEKFRNLHFGLMSKDCTTNGGMLQTRQTLFKAFPIVLDTDNRFRYIYWIGMDGEKIPYEDNSTLTTTNTANQYLRKEKNKNA